MDKTAKSAVLVIGVCLTSVLGFRTARAWQAVSRGAANTVALMSDGDVVAGGFACSPLNFCGGFKVVRLARDSGAERWRYLGPFGDPSYAANAVVVDSASDVVAAGAAFGVVKLAGSTGTEVWRTTPLGGDAKSLAVDSAGDVVVGGTSTHDFTVVKLSGSTGAELWRVTLTGNSPSFDDVAYAVAVDPSGDVVAAGYVFSYPPGNEMVTIKLAGSTGTEVWRHAVAVPTVVSNGDFFAAALAIEPSSGDVITAGGGFTVVRMASGTGDELWRQVMGGVGSLATSVAVDDTGNVAVGGSLYDGHLGLSTFLAVKVAGASGAELWRLELTGNAESQAGSDARAAVTEPGGDVVAAGYLGNKSGSVVSIILRLDGGTGAEIWRRMVDDGRGLSVVDALAIDGMDQVAAAGSFRRGFMVDNIQASDGHPASDLCPPAPLTGCRTGGRSSIFLRADDVDKQRLVWKWARGNAIPSDFGDPRTVTDYQLCVYDNVATTPRLVLRAPVPAGGTCAATNSSVDTPCWETTSTGFRYGGATPFLNGISSVVLKAATAGRAAISAKGSGNNLTLPAALGLTPPVVAQLSNDAVCWTAEYAAADVIANRATVFGARN